MEIWLEPKLSEVDEEDAGKVRRACRDGEPVAAQLLLDFLPFPLRF